MSDDWERRRSSDPRLDSIESTLAEIAKKVDDVDVAAAIRAHIESEHFGLSREDVRRKLSEHDGTLDLTAEHHEMLNRIIDALDGADITDLHGDPVGHDPGLIEKVDDLSAAVERSSTVLDTIEHRTNGGVVVTQKVQRRTPAEWTRSEKIAAASLGGFLFFSALPGIVITIRWIAHLIVEAGL